MEGIEKARNTKLIENWLVYNHDNYIKAGRWCHDKMTEAETLKFIKTLEYGNDRERISFNPDDIYIKSVMETIQEINEEIYK